YASISVPDIVSNIRIDQSWGSAQIMGATHQVRAGFYGNNNADPSLDRSYTGVAPRDELGWAIGGGILLNVPWNKGDKFWVEATYTQGAGNYTGLDNLSTVHNAFQRFPEPPGFTGTTLAGAAVIPCRVGFGWGLDAVIANLSCSGVPDGTATASTACTPTGGLIESGLHL